MCVNKRLLCLICALFILVGMLSCPAFAAGGTTVSTTETQVEIHVSGSGTFYLVKEGSSKVLDTLRLDGFGSFFISLTEPGEYRYEIYSSDDINTQRYVVSISVTLDADGYLIPDVSVYPKGSDMKYLIAYYPIVVVDPPVRKIVKGLDECSDTFEFEFRAVETTTGKVSEMPMPNGLSAPDAKRFLITGSGTAEIGTMYLSKPGVYVYEIRELRGGGTYRYDDSVFRLKYTVVETKDGLSASMELFRNGELMPSDTAEIVFVNEYDPEVTPPPDETPPPEVTPTPEVTPPPEETPPPNIKTGDDYGLHPFVEIFCGSLCVLCLMIFLVSHKQKDDTE